MNEKITFHRIAAAIATATGCGEEEAALFLRALLDKITERLAAGEKVTVAGVGSFAPGESPERPVIWAPDSTLADEVNEPFAAFEPVTLAAGIDESQLNAPALPAQAEPTPEPEAVAPHEEIAAPEPTPEPKLVEEEPELDVSESEPTESTVAMVATDQAPAAETDAEPQPEQVETEADSETIPVPADEPAAVSVPEHEQVEVTPETTVPEASVTPESTPSPELSTDTESSERHHSHGHRRHRRHRSEPDITTPYIYNRNDEDERDHTRLNPWVMMLVGLIVGLALGYLLGMNLGYLTNTPQEEIVDEEYIDSVDSLDVIVTSPDSVTAPDTMAAPAPEAAAKPAVVTDTVTSTRYLTTMARKYYGNNSFWVYIFIENRDKIKNPDRLSPGTVVVIPPAEKYGIDADDPASVRRASAKLAEVERELKAKK